ncbi:MAG: hypothetical protein FWD46_09580 [Cystobacterineae bacterium]|nr:hypothetical protein [Cystobacterineae bacterium]
MKRVFDEGKKVFNKGFESVLAGGLKSVFSKAGLCLGVGLWLLGAAAFAQPRVSIHPLMTEQGPRGKRWNALFMQEAAKQKISMTPEEVVEGFLEKQGGSCKNDDKCLSELGQATRAHYIIIVSMFRNGDTYTLNARIVQSDRVNPEDSLVYKAVGPLYVQSVSRVVEDNNARAAYEKLFAELKLQSLVSHPDWIFNKKPSEAPAPTIIVGPGTREEWVLLPDGRWVKRAEIDELSKKTSPMRVSAYALFGTAAAAAITGTVFAGLADDTFRKYRKMETGEGVVDGKRDLAKAASLRSTTNTYKAVSIATFSAAGAALIAGTTLFFLSPERSLQKAKKQKVQVGFAPMVGGGMFSIGGHFP